MALPVSSTDNCSLWIVSSHFYRLKSERKKTVLFLNWTYPSDRCVVANYDATYLYFEGEIFLQILDNHHQKRQLDAQRFLRIGWTCDICGAYVCANDFQYQALDVIVGDSLDVTISHLFIPNLQRLTANAVQYRQETRLKCILKHDYLRSKHTLNLFLFSLISFDVNFSVWCELLRDIEFRLMFCCFAQLPLRQKERTVMCQCVW